MPRKAMCASYSLVVYLLLLPALVKCCRQTPRKSKIGLHLNGPRKPYNPCKPNPCKNGATCNGAGVDYSCTCRSNYEGKRCDFSLQRVQVESMQEQSHLQ
ncbi:hypothetical protein LSAT2_032012 [Lamellibrachia satsuma]|nr:hypothetical protein LSAT2_032012 [Lamellibrachia satsuma]